VTSLPAFPPRCLSKFRVHRVESTGVGLPIPDGFNSYALACHCGHDTWRVLGNWFENTTEFIGPLFAECSHCGARLRIIDTAVDGYDGEIGDGIVEDDTPSATWVCSECGSSDGALVASFGYQFEPDAEIMPRLQDYFDAFILTHLCRTSRRTVQVTVFECA
jgi:hypothetical protein